MLLRFHRLHHHILAHLSAVHELDPPRDLGEKSVIFTTADIQSRFYSSSALTHNNRPARNNLSAECLEPKRCAFESRPFREVP